MFITIAVLLLAAVVAALLVLSTTHPMGWKLLTDKTKAYNKAHGPLCCCSLAASKEPQRRYRSTADTVASEEVQQLLWLARPPPAQPVTRQAL